MAFAYSEGNPVEDRSKYLKPPFDTNRLDQLMDEAGLDALLVTSKHSIQYLLGNYRFFFYDFMDAHGLSRYLPFFVYKKGQPLDSGYVGAPWERYEKQLGSFWVSHFDLTKFTSTGYAASAVEQIKRLNVQNGRIGIEVGFMPIDAYGVLQENLPDAKLIDATFTLEILRARKSPEELTLLRLGSEKVVESMLAVFGTYGPGVTKRQIVEALREEETKRGLKFEYALTNMGTSMNRAPYDQVWHENEVLALDSGGNYKGYIGDVTRMGYSGHPDQELIDLLGQVEDVQQTARKGLKAGAIGGDLFVRANEALSRSSAKDAMSFWAHGMGIVSHEAPWLTATAMPKYEAYHATRPLEQGMVISVETELHHKTRGFIKLEDTIAITADGWESYGDGGRGWNLCGTKGA
ncbi:MAG: Xaa-Pro peptidase family protein [Acidobacteriaceae bacterium]|nr:Xaa-Pro peptidase family protein [Acidobacteriaceae bacterium]